MNMYPYLCCN